MNKKHYVIEVDIDMKISVDRDINVGEVDSFVRTLFDSYNIMRTGSYVDDTAKENRIYRTFYHCMTDHENLLNDKCFAKDKTGNVYSITNLIKETKNNINFLFRVDIIKNIRAYSENIEVNDKDV